jgi:hypothetical protein
MLWGRLPVLFGMSEGRMRESFFGKLVEESIETMIIDKVYTVSLD